MKQSDDQTLFAWQLGWEDCKDDICGPLATHPSKFSGANNLVPIPDSDSQAPYSMTNKGLMIELPIVHKDDGPYGMAILHCSTVDAFPKQIELPVVRLGAKESTHYARDARHTGALAPTELGVAVPRAIFMKQEPKHSEAWRTGLVARIPVGNTFFSAVSWSADVAAVGLHAENRVDYLFPSSCRRGGILFAGKDNSNLLVLFNIEMQHVERYACKILYCPPEIPRKKYDISTTQRLARNLARNVRAAPNYHLGHRGSRKNYTSEVFAQELAKDATFSLLDTDHSPSNSRRSFEHLPDDRAVYATIGFQFVREQKTLILDVEFEDQQETSQKLFEIDGQPLPIEPLGEESLEQITISETL